MVVCNDTIDSSGGGLAMGKWTLFLLVALALALLSSSALATTPTTMAQTELAAAAMTAPATLTTSASSAQQAIATAAPIQGSGQIADYSAQTATFDWMLYDAASKSCSTAREAAMDQFAASATTAQSATSMAESPNTVNEAGEAMGQMAWTVMAGLQSDFTYIGTDSVSYAQQMTPVQTAAAMEEAQSTATPDSVTRA
jgi:hypothetical protein